MAFYFKFVKPDNKEPTTLGEVGQEISAWFKERGTDLPAGYAVDAVAQWGMAIAIRMGDTTEESIKKYAEQNSDEDVDVDTEMLTEFLAKRYTFSSWYGR